MKSNFRALLFFLLAISFVLTGFSQTADAAFPEKPITIIVGRGAGGSTDMIARTVAPFLTKNLNVPVIVKNVKGGGGKIALGEVYKGKPDGYTLIVGVTPSDITNWLKKPAAFDLKKFTPIYGIAGGDSNGISVSPRSKIKTFKELMESAKKEEVTLAGTQIGSNSWLLALQLRERAGLKYSYVPYDSGNASNMALIGGHVTTCISSSIDLGNLAKDGKIRPLGVASKKRISYIPDVPTFAEQGFPTVINEANQFLMGPPGIPADIQKVLVDACAKSVADPEFVKIASKSFTIEALNPAQLKELMVNTFNDIEDLLRKAGEIK